MGLLGTGWINSHHGGAVLSDVCRYRLAQGGKQICKNRTKLFRLDSTERGYLNTECVCWRNRMLATQPTRDCCLIDTQS